MPMPTPVTLEPSGPEGGGLLAVARSLPSGWQRGVAFTDTSCLAPVVMGECPTGENLKPGNRPEAVAEFRPYSVIMAVECTTFGGYSVESVSGGELDRTREYALARELLTGEVSARDRNPSAILTGGGSYLGNPSLQSEATDLGAGFTSVTAMLACLEQNLAEATSGRGGVLLSGPALATWLFKESLLWRDGARWRTVTGNPVIVSGGFDGRAPGDTAPPDPTDPLHLYAASNVWASVGERATYADVDRGVNTATSRSEDVGLAVFSPCAVFAAASTVALAC